MYVEVMGSRDYLMRFFMTRRFSFFSTIFALAMSGAAVCGEGELQRFAYHQPCMGTTYRVVLYAPDEAAATAAAAAAFERVEQIDAMMTDYDESSELMQLCAKAGGPPVKVSAEIFEVLAKAKEVHGTTRGAFDVTVGPVVKLWRKARKVNALPDPAELAKAKELVGMDNVVLDEKERTVQLRKAGMKLDFGGIAKGYAVDQALAVLRKKGFPMALVVGGGDVGLGDAPPGKEGWTVDVRPLDKSIKEPTQLLLKNAGVSTSGDEEQHLDKNGKRYSHILDPKTGKPIEGRSSVTIVAPNCTMSDALSKTGVLGAQAAVEVIDGLPRCAIYIAIEDGTIHYFESKSWKGVPKGGAR